MSQKPIIRASELSEYTFCHRAWWLKRVRQARSTNTRSLSRGTQAHATHEQQVVWSGRLQLIGGIIVILGILLLLFGG